MSFGFRNDYHESFNAGADLSNDQFHFVKLVTGSEVQQAGAGERAIGVLQNAPEEDMVASVAVFGLTRIEACGGSVAIVAGDPLKSDADGMAVKAATDKDKAIGYAMENCSANNVIIVMFVNPIDIAV